MDIRRTITVVFIFLLLHFQHIRCLSEAYPSPFDPLLRLVWDPSALVYFWTGLDQLYNIALSWREAAVNIVTLPFRKHGPMGDSVSFNGRERALGRIKQPTIVPHLERIRKTYTAENDQQIIVPQPNRMNLKTAPLPDIMYRPGLPHHQQVSVGSPMIFPKKPTFLPYNDNQKHVLQLLRNFKNQNMNNMIPQEPMFGATKPILSAEQNMAILKNLIPQSDAMQHFSHNEVFSHKRRLRNKLLNIL